MAFYGSPSSEIYSLDDSFSWSIDRRSDFRDDEPLPLLEDLSPLPSRPPRITGPNGKMSRSTAKKRRHSQANARRRPLPSLHNETISGLHGSAEDHGKCFTVLANLEKKGVFCSIHGRFLRSPNLRQGDHLFIRKCRLSDHCHESGLVAVETMSGFIGHVSSMDIDRSSNVPLECSICANNGLSDVSFETDEEINEHFEQEHFLPMVLTQFDRKKGPPYRCPFFKSCKKEGDELEEVAMHYLHHRGEGGKTPLLSLKNSLMILPASSSDYPPTKKQCHDEEVMDLKKQLQTDRDAFQDRENRQTQRINALASEINELKEQLKKARCDSEENPLVIAARKREQSLQNEMSLLKRNNELEKAAARNREQSLKNDCNSLEIDRHKLTRLLQAEKSSKKKLTTEKEELSQTNKRKMIEINQLKNQLLTAQQDSEALKKCHLEEINAAKAREAKEIKRLLKQRSDADRETKVYKEKLVQARADAYDTEEQLKKRMQEMENKLRQCSERSDKNLLNQAENECKMLREKLYAMEVELNRRIAQEENEKAILVEKVRILEARQLHPPKCDIENLKQELAASKNEIQRLTKELWVEKTLSTNSGKQTKVVKEKASQTIRSSDKLKKKCDDLLEKNLGLTAELQACKEEARKTHGKLNELIKEKKALIIGRDKLDKAVSALNIKQDEMLTKIASISAEKNSLDGAIASLQSQNEDMVEENAAIIAEKNKLLETKKTLHNALGRQKQRYQQELAEAFEKIEELQKRLDATTNEELKEKAIKLLADNNELVSTNQKIKLFNANLESQMAFVKEEAQNLKNEKDALFEEADRLKSTLKRCMDICKLREDEIRILRGGGDSESRDPLITQLKAEDGSQLEVIQS